MLCDFISTENVPLGGGGSAFLGTSVCTFSSGTTFLGTSGTLKKVISVICMKFKHSVFSTWDIKRKTQGHNNISGFGCKYQLFLYSYRKFSLR